MLSDKELIQLEDFLTMEQGFIKSMYYIANNIQDMQTKQLFQQVASKTQQNFDAVSKHLSAGKTLQ
ncbi:hypothetical protein SDC9_03997 [bioreactor metagenome]|uniref:Spore coat protein n=1 Tax=bioreactor metagenome TaxID=1076179 RepID=A0A644SV11_9ZZZZ|nr:ferritin-like domain-containing protein [Negativicutes bacterium]